MDLRFSIQELGMSHSVYESDPDDKEISDDDDDDRNHKHRRKEDARSLSLESDIAEKVFIRPYRQGTKPSQNGHLYRDNGSQSNETWKRYSFNSLEKDISVKFERKRPGFSQFSRGSSDYNQRIRVNQPFSGDPGAFRAGGRDSNHWSQRDPRFHSVDIASQIVQQGSVPRSVFAGRGLPTVSKSHGSSWSSFGLVPGMPNGGLDMLHPIGLFGSFRPTINPSPNMGLARQRCKDFEEQGFCLRGDMCPMEHGMNRIVIEDVQSLSQFNLPISLASANLSVGPVETGPSLATSVATTTLSNSKDSHGKNIKRGMGDCGLDVSGPFSDSAAADFYDPDRPLWGDEPHTSTAPQSISQPTNGKNGSLLDPGLCGDHHDDLFDGSDSELVRTDGTTVGSLNTRSFVHGRTTSRKMRVEMGENMISKASSSKFMHNETMESSVLSKSTQDPPKQHKMSNLDSSMKMPSGNGRMPRKPSQKAQRTLFVNGIPQQNNRRESLLSHFQKFGEVVDIYIPINSERAFIRFSKKEAAEAALMAPDAIMGNRFIKLWWANRDNIQDIQTVSGPTISVPSRGSIVSAALPHTPVANNRKDDSRSILQSGITPPAPAPVSVSDHPKPVDVNGEKGPPPLQKKLESLEVLKEEIRKKQDMLDQKRNPKPVDVNGEKGPPPLQKKLESLEVLKEEIRKKQDMLDQKRNDFRRKLDKLVKQAPGIRGEGAPEQVAKKQKLGVLADITKATTPSAGDHDTILPSAQDDVADANIKSVDHSRLKSSKTTLLLTLQESLKLSPFSLASAGSPAANNRFKLDNRPTAFKIVPPLPDGLADAPTLTEHFSPYGDLLKVQLDDIEPIKDNPDLQTSKVSARICFTTRHAAEKAFLSGKSWKDHSLQFVWLSSSNSRKDTVTKESLSPTLQGNSDSSKITPKPFTFGVGEFKKTEGT